MSFQGMKWFMGHSHFSRDIKTHLNLSYEFRKMCKPPTTPMWPENINYSQEFVFFLQIKYFIVNFMASSATGFNLF